MTTFLIGDQFDELGAISFPSHGEEGEVTLSPRPGMEERLRDYWDHTRPHCRDAIACLRYDASIRQRPDGLWVEEVSR